MIRPFRLLMSIEAFARADLAIALRNLADRIETGEQQPGTFVASTGQDHSLAACAFTVGDPAPEGFEQTILHHEENLRHDFAG